MLKCTKVLAQLLALLAASIAVFCIAAEPIAGIRYAEHQDLSYFLRSDGTRAVIAAPSDWQQRRNHILQGIEAVMGQLPRPQRPVPLDVEVLEEHKGDGFVRRKIAYHTDLSGKRIRAWLLLPTGDDVESAASHAVFAPNDAFRQRFTRGFVRSP